MRRLNILFAANAVPRRDKDSAERRMMAILEILAKDHDVTIFSTEPEEHFERKTIVRNALAEIGIHRVVAPKTEAIWLLAQNRYDLLFCEYWHVGEFLIPLFRRANPRAHVVVDAVDLEFVRELAGAEVGVGTRDTALQIKQRELNVYKTADLVVNITREDDEIFRSEVPSIPTTILPNIVTIRERPAAVRSKKVFFVGNLQHRPNVDGILWFCRLVWPLIIEKQPEARLEIAGRNPPESLREFEATPSIKLLGYVPRTEPHLDESAVVIAPLRFGGGMKGKVSEAIASAAPVVTTRFGAQGFNAVDGVHMRIADDPSDMAAAVIDLLANPDKAEKMGREGQAQLGAICSPASAERAIQEILQKIATISSPAARPLARATFQCGLKIYELGAKISGWGWGLMGGKT